MKQFAFIYFAAIFLPAALFNAAAAAIPEHQADTYSTASSAVKVLVNTPLENSNLLVQFNQQVRWQQVLAELQARKLDAQWGQLSKPSELAALEAMRTKILKDLHVLGQQWAHKGKQGLLRASIELAEQISALPLVARQPVSMDYDLVRLNANFNPLLSGDYTLQISPRSNVVWVQGLVRLSGKRPFVGGAFAHDYGRRLSLLKGAEQNLLWIIQPDGEVMTSLIDPFAPEFVGVAPGATLYVGFAKLPRKYADLNQRIMTLFANREI